MKGSTMRRAMTGLMLAVLMFSIAFPALAEGALYGYSKDGGYCYVTLGSYPQRVLTGNDKVDGGAPEEKSWTWSRNPVAAGAPVEILTDPILWRVLRVDEEKAYLCSEYVLLAHPLHVNYKEYKTLGKDFAQTDLCAYLNTTFAADAFTEAELAMLADTEYGKVFLLDSTDVKDKSIGMGNNKLKAWGTEYAIRVTNVFVYRVSAASHSPYWVRNQASSDARHGRCTKADGSLGHIVSDRDNEGVRPAAYLALDSFRIVGGSGTKTDPYQLANKGE